MDSKSVGVSCAGRPSRKRADSEETLIYGTDADYCIYVNSETEEDEAAVQILDCTEDFQRELSFSSSASGSSSASSACASSILIPTVAVTAYDKIMTNSRAPTPSILARDRKCTVPSTGKVTYL
jgi:hypothetical protein